MEETTTTPVIKKEHWLVSALFFFPRIIKDALNAFKNNDEGWSMKKVLAAFSTYKAAQFTQQELAPNNVIILVLMWLAYAGILIGIYSIGDISDAVRKVKDASSNSEQK